MSNRRGVFGVAVALSALAGVVAVGAITPRDPDPAKALGEQRLQTMTEPEAMQRWLAVTQPSLGHEVLERFVGDWDVEMKLMPGPDMPPQVSKGKATGVQILGGRYIQGEFEGEMMGMPMSGFSLMGYDNNRKLFNGLWVSSMETGMHVARGALNQDGTVLTMIGEMDEPMSGEIGKTYAMVYHFVSPDQYELKIKEILYGEPFSVVEITYTRAAD